MMDSLIEIVWRPENAVIIGAVSGLLTTAQAVAPEFFARPLVVRLLPLAPLVLCTGALWLPGIPQAELGAGSRVLLGVLLGTVTAWAWKAWRHTVLGRDERLKAPAEPQP